MPARALLLTDEAKHELCALIDARDASPGQIRRARVILLSAQGLGGGEVARRLGLSVGQVSRIRTRFLESGARGLVDQPHVGRRDHAVSPELAARIVALSTSTPPPGRTRWSTRLIADVVGLTSATVSKILRRARGDELAAPGAERRQALTARELGPRRDLR